MLVNFAPTSDVEHCLCTRDPSPVNMYEAYHSKITQTFITKLMTTRCMSKTKKNQARLGQNRNNFEIIQS